jgi:hypothetical protein
MRDGEKWICLAYVAMEVEVPVLDQPHPRLVGHPH